ncbi:MAG: Ig-like domain-containing protein [Verrucomicrobia bacterium]|nr:Ig-like domain-containing protein [Verrucomicrobiota bacterium]
MKRTSLTIQLLAAILAAFATQASAAPLLSVDFGRPGDPVMSGFTAVTGLGPTTIDSYTITCSHSGGGDIYRWAGGDNLTSDALYDNANYLTGYVKVAISGLSPGNYTLKVWCVESATATGVYHVNPDGSTTGSTVTITNTGTADSTNPSTYGIGTYAITGDTLEFRVTGQNNFGGAPNSARVNGFTLEATPLAVTTTTLERTVGSSPANYSDSLTFTATVTGGSTPGGNVEFYEGATLLDTQPLADVGGKLEFRVTGQNNFGGAPNSARVNGFTLEATPLAVTTTTLERTAGSSPANHSDSLTFTATVTGSTPTGNVQFYGGTTLLDTQALADVGGGVYQASFTTSSILANGTHSITAHYVGEGGNAPSTSNAVSQEIVGAPFVPLKVDFGNGPVASGFTGMSTSPQTIGGYTVSWGGNQEGTFSRGGSGTQALIRDFLYNNNNGNGALELNISGLADGTYNLTVWGIDLDGSNGTTVAVNPGTNTTGSTLSISNTGNAYTDSSPEVQATGPFTVSGGTMQLLITGSHGPGGVGGGPRINGFTLDVFTAAISTTTLARTVGSSPANYSDSLTFTATVTGSAPTGNVEFRDGTTLLDTQPLADVGGGVYQASFTTNSTLANGTHSIAAHYVGDSGNAPSTSDAVSQEIAGAPLVPLMVDFGRPGDPVMAGFTGVTGLGPTTIGSYAVTCSHSGSGDFYRWGGGDNLTTDALYDNASYLTGYVKVAISGLSAGNYNLKVWCVESSTAAGVYHVNPDGSTTGSTVTITNAGTANSTNPSTYGIGIYSITGTTLEFKVTGNNNAGNSARVNGFTLEAAGATLTYEAWASTHGIPGEPAGGDYDGDAMTNFQEYAFGLDPTSGTSVNPIKVQLDKAAGTFSYTRTVGTGLAYTVWTSTDLQTWDGPAAVSASVGTVGDVETVEVTLSGSTPPLGGTLFVRVQAAE